MRLQQHSLIEVTDTYRVVKTQAHLTKLLERTARPRVFTFQMIDTILIEATVALGGGRSACFR